MMTPKLKRAGQVEVPFQSAFLLGDGFPMALPWAEREVPIAGRQTANHPENSYMLHEVHANVSSRECFEISIHFVASESVCFTHRGIRRELLKTRP